MERQMSISVFRDSPPEGAALVSTDPHRPRRALGELNGPRPINAKRPDVDTTRTEVATRTEVVAASDRRILPENFRRENLYPHPAVVNLPDAELYAAYGMPDSGFSQLATQSDEVDEDETPDGYEETGLFSWEHFDGDDMCLLKHTQLMELHQATQIVPNYPKMHKEMDDCMRTKLIHWLCDVSLEYTMERETFFLAVNYLDRFLSKMTVSKERLQLAGTACLFIAAKYEEIMPPAAQQFVYITADSYSISELLHYEQTVLKTVHWRVSGPTALWFLGRLEQYMVIMPTEVWPVARFILEMTPYDVRFLKHLPSDLAAACLFYAHHMCLSRDALHHLFRPSAAVDDIGFPSLDQLTTAVTDVHCMYCKTDEDEDLTFKRFAHLISGEVHEPLESESFGQIFSQMIDS